MQHRIEYWGGSKAVGARFQATHNAKYDIVIFLEYAPQNLCEYMSPQASEGAYTAMPDMAMVVNDIKSTAAFMAKKGMLHFDTHHGNIVTDGEHLYFTDFGLAIFQAFELSAAEREFFEKNNGAVANQLFQKAEHLKQAGSLDQKTAKSGDLQQPHNGYDRALALSCFDWPAKTKNGEVVAKLPEVEAVAQKYKIISEMMEKFRGELRDDKSKNVEYPAVKMRELMQQVEAID